MQSMAALCFANKDLDLLLGNEETYRVDSKPIVASHSTFSTPELFHYTFNPSLTEHSASKSLKMMKVALSMPKEGPAMALHPSGAGDGARGFNPGSGPTTTFFLRKSRSRSTHVENGNSSLTLLVGPEPPESTPPTPRPSAPQPTDLVTINNPKPKKRNFLVPDSAVDRLLKATRPSSPSGAKSALERLELQYGRLKGAIGADEIAEPVRNDIPLGRVSPDFPTSADKHSQMDGALPEPIHDLYGNVPNLKTGAAYSSLVEKPVSNTSSHHFLLAPAPILYEETVVGRQPFAKYRAKFTYADRYLPPSKPTISSLDDSPERPEATGRSGVSVETASSTKGLTSTQVYPLGPRLLANRQGHLDSLDSRRVGMPTHPLPAIPKGRPRSNAMRVDRGPLVTIPRTTHGDIPPSPTTHSFQERLLVAQADYDVTFFPSLPPRKGTPPPPNFGKANSDTVDLVSSHATSKPVPPSARPSAHSSLLHTTEEYGDMVQKFTARTVVSAEVQSGSEWRGQPSWGVEESQSQSSCSSPLEDDLSSAGHASYGNSYSPYSSVYFGSIALSSESSDEPNTSPVEDEATPKAGYVYKK